MEEKKEFTNIRDKLQHVQYNLKAPKGQYNSFGDYHYRSCEDIQEALKPLLHEVKALLLLNDEIVQVGDRIYIKATAILQDVESGDSISNTAYARESESRPKMDAAQITGSCSSYARKYALNGLFCIDDAKDPDTMNNSTEKPYGNTHGCTGATSPAPAAREANQRGGNIVYVKQQHINTIRKEIERTGAKETAVCYQYKIKTLDKMTMQQYKNAMDIFKQMPSKIPEGQQYELNLMDMEQYDGEMPFR